MACREEYGTIAIQLTSSALTIANRDVLESELQVGFPEPRDLHDDQCIMRIGDRWSQNSRGFHESLLLAKAGNRTIEEMHREMTLRGRRHCNLLRSALDPEEFCDICLSCA